MKSRTSVDVADVTDFRAVAGAIRAIIRRNGDEDRGKIRASLEAVAAEMEINDERSPAQASDRMGQIRYLTLKAQQLRGLAWIGENSRSAELLRLAQELEDGAERQKRSSRLLVSVREFFAAPRGMLIGFGPAAVAVIALVAVGWPGGWLTSLGSSHVGAAETALNEPTTMQSTSPRPGPEAPPTDVVALPPPVIHDPPPPVTNAAPPPPAVPNIAVPPPLVADDASPSLRVTNVEFPPPMTNTAQPLSAAPSPLAAGNNTAPPLQRVTNPDPASRAVTSAARPLPTLELGALGEGLAAKVVASKERVATLAAPSEPQPRRGARPTASADAPAPVRWLGPTRGHRDDAGLPPPRDAADLPPLGQPPQSASSTGGPRPLVTAAPELGSGGTAQSELTGSTSPPSIGECVPYTSEMSRSGRSESVQGLACRDANGRWQRMSEVARPNQAP